VVVIDEPKILLLPNILSLDSIVADKSRFRPERGSLLL